MPVLSILYSDTKLTKVVMIWGIDQFLGQIYTMNLYDLDHDISKEAGGIYQAHLTVSVHAEASSSFSNISQTKLDYNSLKLRFAKMHLLRVQAETSKKQKAQPESSMWLTADFVPHGVLYILPWKIPIRSIGERKTF